VAEVAITSGKVQTFFPRQMNRFGIDDAKSVRLQLFERRFAKQTAERSEHTERDESLICEVKL
jgi:hypothetical protein